MRVGAAAASVKCIDSTTFINTTTRPTTQVDIVDKAHMPLVAFALKPELNLPYTVFEIQDKLRERG